MTIVKDGAAHLAALDRDRAVYLDGNLIPRVADHPAFREACRSAAALYDFQAEPENLETMTFDVGDGRRVGRAWQIPTGHDDLVAKRKAMTAWAELHAGFLGRSPDHVANTMAGMMMGIDVFEDHGARYAGAVRDYYRFARDEDLFLTYVIINPQADRSRAWGEQQNENLIAHLVDQDRDGIVVRGAKMLGTSAIMAEEVFVANIQPLRPGEEHLALSFAVPLDSPGLKILSRKSYEAHATSSWDNPLSSRFDENDAILYFDEVTIPWERVFVCGDTDMCRRQFHETPAHILQNFQAQVRLAVKLRFLLAVARRITETIGTINLPPVQATLGRMAAQAATVESQILGMEAGGEAWGPYFVPNRHFLYAAQVYGQDLYPRFIADVRELAGGGLIMLPSSADDLANPDVAAILDAMQVSARDGEAALERMTFLKLAWDAIGSEFASRHLQYEMFYAGAAFVSQGHSFRTYDWRRAESLMEGFLP